MRKKYAIAYCDGYYITENGRGILDLAHTQDQEFAIFVRDALNAAEQSVQPTIRKQAKNARRRVLKTKLALPATSG